MAGGCAGGVITESPACPAPPPRHVSGSAVGACGAELVCVTAPPTVLTATASAPSSRGAGRRVREARTPQPVPGTRYLFQTLLKSDFID
ncbi:hypothetical protein Y1Q_0022807 [Alligator mississippiensis]|uniref:Uncharacterized protein n=1 Tax=Alligator mississippiensis TaxID=8496 RepID=A0A151N4G1_ALLMI|nr:hypothetical protein Y1Q_0022807 [Alligator mississippiensis]